MEKEKAKKTYLAFIRISAGSSWYQSSDCAFELLALRAVKQAVKDWKHLFKFKKEEKKFNSRRLTFTLMKF